MSLDRIEGKQIKSIKHVDGKVILELEKESIDLKDLLGLDDTYHPNIAEMNLEDLQKNYFDGKYIIYVKVYGPTIRLPVKKKIITKYRTTVSIAVSRKPNDHDCDNKFIVNYDKK